MNETLSVTAIKKGTVIDHIPEGQATRIVHLLKLDQSKNKITLGLHLPSKFIAIKDIIKIEDCILTDVQLQDIAVFAPKATINIIENFKVVNKIKARLPEMIKNIFICPNTNCITQAEAMASIFYIAEHNKQMLLLCHYCDKTFMRDALKLKIFN